MHIAINIMKSDVIAKIISLKIAKPIFTAAKKIKPSKSREKITPGVPIIAPPHAAHLRTIPPHTYCVQNKNPKPPKTTPYANLTQKFVLPIRKRINNKPLKRPQRTS
jgi:hypothetical protein